ncbi:hypothetical protein Tco_0974610 [Tanacetum coccineum]|uniref:Reverse transcriptase domain-containing protein n=1 Tax=Tanacetum coccineum TaxID=301880 RepID=A0ABQ5EC47_9ASTR
MPSSPSVIVDSIVQFLGHLIDSQGLHVDPAKIETVKNWASPTYTEEISQILRSCGYYGDSSSLQHILDQKELNMRQCRWLELLVDYDCEIRYHLGKANVIANALSRKEQIKPLRETDIRKRTKNKAKNDKTEHEMEKSERQSQLKAGDSQSQQKSQPRQIQVNKRRLEG